MNALSLFNENFIVSEKLLQQYQLASGLQMADLSEDQTRSLCSFLGKPLNSRFRVASNDRLTILAHSNFRLPDSYMEEGGLDFLLRQAIVVACTSLEAFLWDTVQQNALTIIRAQRASAGEEIRNLTLTLEDYVALEGIADQEVRLKKIILKNFERKTLYDIRAIERIAYILTIKEFWRRIEKNCGESAENMKRLIGELIARRNLISHRADRLYDGSESDGHGLRPITFSWVNLRIQTTKTFVMAASELFNKTITQLKLKGSGKDGQKLSEH